MKININAVIRKLIFYDLVTNFGFGLLSPILAIFVVQSIPGSSLKTIGIMTACYWIARVTTTVPLSRFMDKTDGERDEFYFAVVGSFIFSTIPLLYIIATVPWHLYLIQFLLGLANSMAVPAWRILFVDHLDNGKHAFEWSLDDVGNGIAIGLSAYIGSTIASSFGFQFLFILLSLIGYVGTLIMMTINKYALSLTQLKRRQELESVKSRRRRAFVKSA
jgi:MFS family permease